MTQMGQYWFLCPLLFIIMLLAVFFLARRYGNLPCFPPARSPEAQDPLAILRIRYAKGEIDRETFERMKKELSL